MEGGNSSGGEGDRKRKDRGDDGSSLQHRSGGCGESCGGTSPSVVSCAHDCVRVRPLASQALFGGHRCAILVKARPTRRGTRAVGFGLKGARPSREAPGGYTGQRVCCRSGCVWERRSVTRTSTARCTLQLRVPGSRGGRVLQQGGTRSGTGAARPLGAHGCSIFPVAQGQRAGGGLPADAAQPLAPATMVQSKVPAVLSPHLRPKQP